MARASREGGEIRAVSRRELDARIVQVLKARGIERLYTHQRQALDCALAGRDFVVVTPDGVRKNAVL